MFSTAKPQKSSWVASDNKKRWKKQRSTEQGCNGVGGEDMRGNGTVRHVNSSGGSAAEMSQDPWEWVNSASS